MRRLAWIVVLFLLPGCVSVHNGVHTSTKPFNDSPPYADLSVAYTAILAIQLESPTLPDPQKAMFNQAVNDFNDAQTALRLVKVAQDLKLRSVAELARDFETKLRKANASINRLQVARGKLPI